MARIGTVEQVVRAPRELVFEVASAIGGTLPGGPPHHAELLYRDGDSLIVRYSAHPRLRWFGFIEEVTLERPSRIDYRVLSGPIDFVVEWLELAEGGGGTLVTYGGLVEHRIPLVARWVAAPMYRRYMRRMLRAMARAAEARAARSRRYGPS